MESFDSGFSRYQNVNKEKTGLYFNQSSVQRKICCHNSNESFASTYVCIPPSRYSKSIGAPMDCIYQGDCLLPKHLRHIRNMALYLILLPLFRSLSVKSSYVNSVKEYIIRCMNKSHILSILSCLCFGEIRESITINPSCYVHFVL